MSEPQTAEEAAWNDLDGTKATDDEACNQWQAMLTQGNGLTYGATVAVRQWNRRIIEVAEARAAALDEARAAVSAKLTRSEGSRRRALAAIDACGRGSGE